MLVKLDYFPKFRGENKKYLKPPPSCNHGWEYSVGLVFVAPFQDSSSDQFPVTIPPTLQMKNGYHQPTTFDLHGVATGILGKQQEAPKSFTSPEAFAENTPLEYWEKRPHPTITWRIIPFRIRGENSPMLIVSFRPLFLGWFCSPFNWPI